MPFDGNTKHIGTMYSWDAVRARIRAEAEAVGKAEFVLAAELTDEDAPSWRTRTVSTNCAGSEPETSFRTARTFRRCAEELALGCNGCRVAPPPSAEARQLY